MDLLGDLLKTPSGDLAPLTITPQSPSSLKEVKALFNPNAYTVTKQVRWGPVLNPGGAEGDRPVDRKVNAPQLDFAGGDSRTLRFDLFFDVTEKPDNVKDVRELTNKIVALTRIEPGQNQPPVCVVSWGPQVTGSDFPFRGVISNLEQRFTLFRANGTPVRATLGVTFTECIHVGDDKKEHDPDLTTHVVTRGETLSAIAAKMYRNPALWRPIAEANGIDDPRRLEAGRRLSIPKL
jgi:nucleoid-associated protein YgaU